MSQRTEFTRLIRDPEAALVSEDPAVRRVAVASVQAHPHLWDVLTTMLHSDPDPLVRRECAEVLGRTGVAPLEALVNAMQDPDAQVREAAASGLGEIANPDTVGLLIASACNDDEDRLVREAAVAALGSIGDVQAVPVLIDLISSAPPQIRRRCVPALSVFDGDEVEAALRGAARDRNPMVREAAEMVVGRSTQ